MSESVCISENDVAARLVTDVEELQRLSEPWRELAHACRCPAALPGWQLAWWRHLAPEGAQLRAVAVFDDGDLVGLAPFYLAPGRSASYRLIGGNMTRRMRPLACPGTAMEARVLAAVAGALAAAAPSPDLVVLEGVDKSSAWVRALEVGWPGALKPWRYVTMTQVGPVIDTSGGDFDAWFEERGIHLRRNLRAARRRAAEAGARIVIQTSEQGWKKALREYRRLHLARLQRRGGSSLGEREFAMIEDAARELIPSSEMKVHTVETAKEVVAVAFSLSAGGETLLVSSGFDDAYAKWSPINLIVLEIAEQAFSNGESRIDFGGGVERHKRVFANSDSPISWGGLAIRSHRYPLTRLRLVPERLRWHRYRLAHRFLSQSQINRIKHPLRSA